jgi:hypothetical protein
MIVLGEPGARYVGLAECAMALASTLRRVHASLIKSAGTVVFGMEDGAVSRCRDDPRRACRQTKAGAI